MGWGRSHLPDRCGLLPQGAAYEDVAERWFRSHPRIPLYTCCPRAVLKNLEWGIAEVLQMPLSLKWEPQPLLSGSYKSEIAWNGIQGSGSRLVSSLKGWHYLTFELFESSSQGSDGSLYMFSPELVCSAGLLVRMVIW